MEPIDYEEYIQQHSSLLARDPLRSILDFPIDDVQVKIFPRKIRTLSYVLPTEKRLPINVQNCVNCYTNPLKTVYYLERCYSCSSYLRQPLDKSAPLSPSLYQQEFEIDRDFLSFDDTGYTVNNSELKLVIKKTLTFLF